MKLTLKADSFASDLLLSVLTAVKSTRDRLLIAASVNNEVLLEAAIDSLDDLDGMLLSLDNQGYIELGSRYIS